MKNNYLKLLVIVAAFLVLSLVTSASYAYYVAYVRGNDSVFDTVITTGDLSLQFVEGNNISFYNAIPGKSITKYFGIYNDGNSDTTYDVYLSELANKFADKNDLVYTISEYNYGTPTQESGCYKESETIVPSVVGEESKIITSCPIKAGKIHAYALTITFKDDGTNQDDNKGRGFSAKLSVNDYKELEHIAMLTTGEDFNSKVKPILRDAIVKIMYENKDDWCSVISGSVPLENATCDEMLDYHVSHNIDSDSLFLVSIQIVDSVPDGVVPVDVSAVNSYYPINAWAENGILYLNSEDTIYYNENSSHMFEHIAARTDLVLTGINTSKLRNMHGMFDESDHLVSVTFGDDFDTSNVENMSSLFYNNGSLTSVTFGRGFDTSKVVDMSSMFYGVSSMEVVDVSSFDTSNVRSMRGMFDSMKKLQSLDVSNFDTSNVEDMQAMFASLHTITSINLGNNFDTSKVRDFDYMFTWNKALPSLDLGPKFVVNNANVTQMFYYCEALVSLYTDYDFPTSANGVTVFGGTPKLVGGAGTAYKTVGNRSGLYARVDDPTNSKPGYFTSRSVLTD